MKKRVRILSYIALVLTIAMLFFYPLPYYITKPGIAQELKPIINVQGGYEEQGAFMLTTVRMGRATPLSYAMAHIQDFHHLYPEEDILQQGESDSDYTVRQLHMMDTSKDAAVIVAYNAANKEIKFENKGVYIVTVVPDMPAYGKLKIGDIVKAVDGQTIETAEELIEYVAKKKKGDKVAITILRNDEEKIVELPLASFPDDQTRFGLGISLETSREVDVEPDVEIDTEKIGGPSAGLMFSLEIYNQLVKEDITKGHKVAGTGTINDKGIVGPIGGISQKIVAADKEGAEVFFAPNQQGAANSNYKEAVQAGAKIDTDMKIVPVDTFNDAIEYLEKLDKVKKAE
ncbi:SepM family pheromone-processing serine protease [Priestia flexa]|uniref:SepM family pheromone-processing serine protease n=1 Tax=Priestia flexa TaxID=86664 RepID=UPI0028F73514|nr:SepM family pheromone-processing serine protease [Priestia flexa]